MFDVAWTEPVETVGQRKTRKDKKANRLSQGSSIQSSNSGDVSASLSQTRSSLLGIFNNKKAALQRSASSSKLTTVRSESTLKASKRISSYTTASDSSNNASAKTSVRIPPHNYSEDRRHSSADTDVSSPSDESVFSGWNARLSTTTESSWGSKFTGQKGEMVQPLSRNSTITQSTGVTVSPRDSVNKDEQIATVVRISSAGTVPIEITNSPPRPHLSPISTTIFNFPIPILDLTKPSLVPPSRSGIDVRDVLHRPKRGSSEISHPPKAWQCPSTKGEQVLVTPSKASRQNKERKRLPRPTELSHLQNNIRKMKAASPKIILERLKEEWIGVADASIYRELELEKQLWMLAALKAFEANHLSVRSNRQYMDESTLATMKILSLYENKASSSFLSASNSNIEVHHLSTTPLLPKHYPNIRPLVIPGPSTQLPYASNIFASIHAFSLPALLPASSIPTLLKDCQRTLISSHQTNSSSVTPTTPMFPSTSTKAGSLHLTVLDPSPIHSTLGPLLRAWLDAHLIVNLERQFRCINPARLFPIWLADAGLRAEGSTISNVRFMASVSHDADSFSVINGAGQEQGVVSGECTEQELKSMVGRMLWKEIWGPFVEGESWWWEDEKVNEECERFGSCWECSFIEAVKEG